MIRPYMTLLIAGLMPFSCVDYNCGYVPNERVSEWEGALYTYERDPDYTTIDRFILTPVSTDSYLPADSVTLEIGVSRVESVNASLPTSGNVALACSPVVTYLNRISQINILAANAFTIGGSRYHTADTVHHLFLGAGIEGIFSNNFLPFSDFSSSVAEQDIDEGVSFFYLKLADQPRDSIHMMLDIHIVMDDGKNLSVTNQELRVY